MKFNVSYNIKSLVATDILDDSEYSVICTLYEDETLYVETYFKKIEEKEMTNDYCFACGFISFQSIEKLTSDEILNKFLPEKKKGFWAKLFT